MQRAQTAATVPEQSEQHSPGLSSQAQKISYFSLSWADLQIAALQNILAFSFSPHKH